MSEPKAKVKNPNRLGFGRLLLWKSSDVSAAWINVITLNYLTIYASDTLGLNVGVVGTLLLISKIVDAFTDILAGWLVDNTHTRWGKARPYEISIVGMTVCSVLLFAGSPSWSSAVKFAWIFFMYTLTFSVFATLRTASGNPYTIRHFSNNPVLIRKVASYGSIITMAASLVMNVVFPILMGRIATSASGWTAAVALVMIPATLIGVLRFIFCKEDPSVDEESKQEKIRFREILTLFKRNKYVWYFAVIMLCYNIITNLSIGSYYFKWIVGNIELAGSLSVVGIVLLPLMLAFPAIMKKIGSMGKMIASFCVVGIIGFIICFISGSFLPGVLVGYTMGQFATLPLAYYGVLFIMNICTYNEMLGMPRMDGSSGILSNFASKAGAAVGSWITGILLMLAGYVSAENAVSQPASALAMIRIDFAIVPALLLVIIAACCIAFSKLEKKTEAFEAERKAKLEGTE